MQRAASPCGLRVILKENCSCYIIIVKSAVKCCTPILVNNTAENLQLFISGNEYFTAAKLQETVTVQWFFCTIVQ